MKVITFDSQHKCKFLIILIRKIFLHTIVTIALNRYHA